MIHHLRGTSAALAEKVFMTAGGKRPGNYGRESGVSNARAVYRVRFLTIVAPLPSHFLNDGLHRWIGLKESVAQLIPVFFFGLLKSLARLAQRRIAQRRQMGRLQARTFFSGKIH